MKLIRESLGNISGNHNCGCIDNHFFIDCPVYYSFSTLMSVFDGTKELIHFRYTGETGEE